MIESRIVAAIVALTLSLAASAAEERAWTETLERISSGVVSIRVDGARAGHAL